MIQLDEIFQISEEDIINFIVKNDFRKLLSEVSADSGAPVDDSTKFLFPDKKFYESEATKMAEKLGFQVIDFLINNIEIEKITDTRHPNGPPDLASYFPIGNKDSKSFSWEEIKKTPEYNEWISHIRDAATLIGWKFLTDI